MKLVNDSLNVDYGHLPPSRRLGYRIPHGHLTDQVAVHICEYTYRCK
ncbi:hypothetical protein [uncultured Limosilactobacillus sp.]|nr:hypothetical protein [uncultured Limosilactobacillus sp.]